MKKSLALVLCALLFAPVTAAAQAWPTKTVRIIVPFGPGSTPDMVGRLIGDQMQQKLGQPFVIENRPGASANTGTDIVAKADPDGYTVGVSLGGPLAINTLLFAKMPYDPAKDIALITMLTTQPSVLVVQTSLKVESVAELLELLRKNPEIRILAVSLGRRSALLPDVPTLKEAGLDVEADAWNGLIAPANTPEPIIAKIHDAAVDALREPLIREKLAAQFMEPIPTTPAQFRAKIDADLARWSPVIKALDLKIN